jgi:hypothetical protein
MTRQQVLDLHFVDARHKLTDLAAFVDRVERASGEPDFRWTAFQQAMHGLFGQGADHAERVLVAFSDPTTEPVPRATAKGAVGAWRPLPTP